MKVLTIDHLFFKLPDGFEGGLAEALRVMADYHEEPKTIEGQQREAPLDASLSWTEVREKMWTLFLTAIGEGAKLCGNVSLAEMKGSETTNLDVNTGVSKA